MEAITKFRAYNGDEFATMEQCDKYEQNCRAADAVVALLKPTPKDDGCRFTNGHGYIQQDVEVFERVRSGLLLRARDECPHKFIDQSIADPGIHSSWAGRIIGEGCTKQLNRAWHRIMCTDAQFREWGQPFFANNPEKGDQICLNQS